MYHLSEGFGHNLVGPLCVVRCGLNTSLFVGMCSGWFRWMASMPLANLICLQYFVGLETSHFFLLSHVYNFRLIPLHRPSWFLQSICTRTTASHSWRRCSICWLGSSFPIHFHHRTNCLYGSFNFCSALFLFLVCHRFNTL